MDQRLSVGDDQAVKRDVVIRLLVTQAERDAMQAAADKEELTLSEWIRRRCVKTTTTVDAAPDQAADPLRMMSAAAKKRMWEALGGKLSGEPGKKGKPGKKGGKS